MSNDRSTVYLVDDDPAVLRAVSRLLRTAGFDVAPFPSAQSFLDRHDPSIPGCAVVDVALPALDGLELQRRLSEAGFARPVIFITGRGDVPTSVRAMKAGAVDFLTKPLKARDLLAAVGKALDVDRSQRQARADRQAIEDRIAELTPREREVLKHVVTGQLNKQIAADLGIGE